MHKQINQLVRVAPLIVVPAHELHERRAQLNASLRIENRRARIGEKVRRNNVVAGRVNMVLGDVVVPRKGCYSEFRAQLNWAVFDPSSLDCYYVNGP